MQKIHNSIANALDLRPFALTNCMPKSKLNASTDSHDWLCCHIEFCESLSIITDNTFTKPTTTYNSL